MDTKQNILIFSAYKAGLDTDVNEVNHQETLLGLQKRGIATLELEGKFDGIEEKSILVIGFENEQLVKDLCKDLNQDAYLKSHNDRYTEIVWHDGVVNGLGYLRPVSKEEAQKSTGYSYNPSTGTYYVIQGV